MSYFPNNTLAAAPTDWRLLLSEEDRKVNVGRLFKGLELLNQSSVDATQRFQLSKKWENEAYNTANTRDDYNTTIGIKLREITGIIQNSGSQKISRNLSQQAAQQQQAVQQQQQQQIPLQQQSARQQQQQQIFRMLQANPALHQKLIQQDNIRKMQLRQQSQQLQMSQNPQQIAVAQANGFMRPNTQIQSQSPKPNQQGGTFRTAPSNVLSPFLTISPEAQMSDDIAKKVNAYLRTHPQVQQNMPQDMAAMSAESQFRIRAGQQVTTNTKLSPSQIIQSPINTLKTQVSPSQNPGPSVLIMPPRSGVANNQSPNLPNNLSSKVSPVKIPQNSQGKQLTSPAVQHANVTAKSSTPVSIGTIPNSSSISAMPSGNQVVRPVMMPNDVTAATVMLVPGMAASNAALLGQGNVLLNGQRTGVMVRPNIPVMRPGDVTMSNGASSTSGQYATLTPKEEAEALAVIKEIDKKAHEKKIQYHEIHDLSNEDKLKIREKLRELEPMYKNVDKVLPYFWHYTKSSPGTFRLLGMKYMIEDQINAMPGKFLLSLDTVDHLHQHFRKYFDFVDSRRRGIDVSVNFNTTIRPPPQYPPNIDFPGPRIGPSDLVLPSQRMRNEPNNSTTGKKRRQSSTEQETQQHNKKQTTNNNNVQSKSTPDVMIIDPPNTALPKTSALSSDNRKSHGTVISDDRPTIGYEPSQGNAFHKSDATSEEIRKSAQWMTSLLRKYVRGGVPSSFAGPMIGGLSNEENEQNIMISLTNTA